MSKNICISDIIAFIHKYINSRYLTLNLYFTEKKPKKYLSFSPNAALELKKNILDYILSDLDKIKEYPSQAYNPIGTIDNTIEMTKTTDIEGFTELIDSFKNSTAMVDDIKPEKINFYTLNFKIKDNDNEIEHNIYFFRRINKLKRLNSEGILAKIKGKELNKIDSKIIGIDGDVDIITFDNYVFIINHIALERIFRIIDQFVEKTNEALSTLEAKGKIQNFEDFKEACLNDIRIEKYLTKLLATPDILEHTLDDLDLVKKAINYMGWNIPISEQGKKWQIVYDAENTSKIDLMNIIYLIKDSCYESVLLKRHDVDKYN